MDIEALERLIEPEDEEVCLRCILKYSTRGSSNIFQLFDTSEKKDHLVAHRRRWLEHQAERVAMQERWQDEWHDVECQGVVVKVPPCPENAVATAKLVLSQRRRRPLGIDWKTGEGETLPSRNGKGNVEILGSL